MITKQAKLDQSSEGTMRKAIFFLVAILVIVATSFSLAQEAINASQSEAITQVGRFQLFQGYYQALVKDKGGIGEYDKKAVFKLDTQTGETWMYQYQLVDGKVLKGWFKIEGSY